MVALCSPSFSLNYTLINVWWIPLNEFHIQFSSLCAEDKEDFSKFSFKFAACWKGPYPSVNFSPACLCVPTHARSSAAHTLRASSLENHSGDFKPVPLCLTTGTPLWMPKLYTMSAKFLCYKAHSSLEPSPGKRFSSRAVWDFLKINHRPSLSFAASK